MFLFSQLPTFGSFTSGTWNFSESGHGKGAADGVGGSMKRMADRLIAQGEDIPNPLAFYNALNGKTVAQLFYITSDDI